MLIKKRKLSSFFYSQHSFAIYDYLYQNHLWRYIVRKLVANEILFFFSLNFTNLYTPLQNIVSFLFVCFVLANPSPWKKTKQNKTKRTLDWKERNAMCVFFLVRKHFHFILHFPLCVSSIGGPSREFWDSIADFHQEKCKPNILPNQHQSRHL